MTEDDLVGDGFHVPIEFHVSAGIESKYATNMVVHYQEHEFIIHFFEAYTPFFLGSPGELEEQRQSATSVRAECVARIVVAAERMPGFVEALQTNLDKYRARKGVQDE